MKFIDLLLRRSIQVGLLVLVVMSSGFMPIAPVKADGGIAISGSFYQQSFEIPLGSSISGPDVYVVVFNNSSDQIKVNMTSQAPPGMRLVMSQNEFTLAASEQQQIWIRVEVGTDAVPGKYEISVSAETYKEGVSGIQLTGAASQKASLVIKGESGIVSIQATSPDQQPIQALVRLYRVVSGKELEIAYSENGILEVKVVPGSFVAASFMGGIKLAEERFDITANENKKIILSGAIVYFEGFDIVPNFQKENGKLAFIQIVYTVKNLGQRVEKGEVFLQVNRDGESPFEQLLATISPMETGRAGLNYNYIPTGGWANGNYDFKLQLKLDDKLYATSSAKQFEVQLIGSTENGDTLIIVIGSVLVVIILGAIGWILVQKRKKRV
jgi:hypothetical protein